VWIRYEPVHESYIPIGYELTDAKYMNKENREFHPIGSIKSWMDSIRRRVGLTSGLEYLEEPSRYPVFGGMEEFDAELRIATTKLQKACIYAREGEEEMVAGYQLTFDPRTYDEIYRVALLRHAQKAEAERTRKTVESYGQMMKEQME
jgi:hypothetical protein